MPGQEREQRLGLEDKERQNSERWVVDISEYTGSSGRLIGIRELEAVGARTPEPFFVATHEAFEEYKIQGMTAELCQPLLDAFQQIRAANPDRGAFVGWRTATPEGPVPGPRTAAIDGEEKFLQHVEASWKWALNHNYNQGRKNEVALAFHPFIHAGDPPMIEEPFLQWPGGDAAPRAEGGIKIRAGFGPDELVQSYPADNYLIRVGRYETRVQKKIPCKQTTIQAIAAEYPEVAMPPEFQERQALPDSQILAIAEVVMRLGEKYGPRRIEFIVQPEGIIFRECTSYDPEPEHFFFLEEKLVLPVRVINGPEDVDQIAPPTELVFLPQHLFRQRQVPEISLLLVNHSQQEKIELAVLAWGTIQTQHMAKNFRDARITVVFIGDQRLEDGQVVRVFQEKDGAPAWEIVGEKKAVIMALNDPRAREKELAGEKAASLAILAEQGIPVPPGFCIPTTAKSLTSSVIEEIQERLAQFPGATFSVRSSSLQENIAAGQFQSFLDVPSENVLNRIKDCRASLFSSPAVISARNSGLGLSEQKMAVLVHPMIHGRGGVIYTNPQEIIITAAQSAAAVTSGEEAEAHQIILDRNREILSQRGERIIQEKEIQKLAELALKVENIFQTRQDIEWVIDEQGQPWILQARSR